MVKIWISDKLELRWNEWPEKEFWPEGTEKHEDNARALAKAKEESICLPRVEFVNAITGGKVKLKEAIEYIEKNYKPDTFVDVPISITVDRDQAKCCQLDCRASMHGGQCKAELIIKVARLKPVNSAHSFTEGSDPGVGQYYEKAHGLEPVLIGAGPPEITSLKARILEAFKKRKWKISEFHNTASDILSEVLDDLNIK